MDFLLDYLGASPGTEHFFVLCCVFVGVIFFLGGMYFSFFKPLGQKKVMSQRWGVGQKVEIHAQLLKNESTAAGSPVLSLLKRITNRQYLERLQHSLYRGDIFCPLEVFLSLAGILACFGLALGILLAQGYFTLILALGMGALPFFYLRIKQHIKSSRLEKQMPEGMDFFARSLRAGHTLQSCLEMVSSEIGPPLGTEMKIVFEEQRLGLGMVKALQRLADRVDSQDLRFFVTAILIQMETGGNLAEILESIGKLIRKRLELKGKVSTLTAEGKYSALILTLLPVGIFAYIYLVNPKYVMMLFTDPLGHRLLMFGIISMVVGIIWMRKMIQIKV